MDLSSLHGAFYGIHLSLAHLVNTPEIAITEGESRDFLGAAQNVLRHYGVEATQKTIDWLALGSVALSMYGTRAVAIYARRRGEAASNVTHGQRPGPVANGHIDMSPAPEFDEHFDA